MEMALFHSVTIAPTYLLVGAQEFLSPLAVTTLGIGQNVHMRGGQNTSILFLVPSPHLLDVVFSDFLSFSNC